MTIENGLHIFSTGTYQQTANTVRIRELRKGAGLSVREAAKVLRLRVGTVSQLETGQATLSATEWSAIFSSLESIVPGDGGAP